MKPTHSAMSTEGIKVVSWDIDTCGFFARTVEDLELIATVFALERDPSRNPVSLSGIRVAVIETPFFDQAGNGTRAAMSRASEILKDAGVKSIEKVELPFENVDGKTLNRIHKTVFGFEAKSTLLVDVRLDKQHEMNSEIRKFVEEPKYSAEEMIQAREAYERMRLEFDKFAVKYDAIIAPSAEDVAPEGLDDMGAAIFNFIWTVRRLLSMPRLTCTMET
jgi:Asp-tRNA(Asn)/Glu-tRNA(Gln) amidotransferase A subunit family amidase